MCGSSRRVMIRIKMHSSMPLTGVAYLSPIAWLRNLSRSPPFRMAAGIKQIHIPVEISVRRILLFRLMGRGGVTGGVSA